MATQAKPLNEVKQISEVTETTAATMDSAVGAAFVAAGIGSTVLGLAVVLNEVSPAISNLLKWVGPMGPLSGKVGLAVIAFVVSWIALHVAFRNRVVKLTTSFAISLALVLVGFLLTFPPIFVFIKHIFVP
jgi:integral membrane sensor domain MASE1